MPHEHIPILTNFLHESTQELFGFYNTPMQAHEFKYVRDLEMGFVGLLGFTGDELRGTLMLGLTDDLLRIHCHLGPTEEIPRSAARDWVGELTNQLLGRLKNKLIPYGVTLYLSTPVTLTGQRIMLLSSDKTCALGPTLFRHEEEFACLWFEYELNEAHPWECSADPDAPSPASEGDLMLF